MKNYVTFQYTKFVNMTRDLDEMRSVTYGYRLYKGDWNVYNNSAPTPRAFCKDMPDDSTAVINFIKENHPDFWEVIVEDGAFMYCNRKVIVEGDKHRYSI